jgi:2-(1,2-epoxy-1,2-dihydrophenyl)acetyl-CoA isomerase
MSLLTSVENGVGYIILNRQEKFNSINKDLALAIQQALIAFESDEAVRAVYMSAVGKAFCAGQDLAEVMDPNGPEMRSIVKEHYNPIIKLMRNLKKPIVVAVNGVAAGAGANIALAGDVVVASENASFIQAFSKIGLIPDSAGTYILPKLVGFQKALALAMLGDKVSAVDAEKMGMIYKALSAETFEQESKAIAQQLAQMPTVGLVQTKLAFNKGVHNTLSEQLALEEEIQTMCGQTEDFNEGVNAFLEKRNPVFKGK